MVRSLLNCQWVVLLNIVVRGDTNFWAQPAEPVCKMVLGVDHLHHVVDVSCFITFNYDPSSWVDEVIGVLCGH